MSGGPEDPDNVLLRIDGATAEYWESPGKVAVAVQMAKGLVSDDKPDLGDNDTVAALSGGASCSSTPTVPPPPTSRGGASPRRRPGRPGRR